MAGNGTPPSTAQGQVVTSPAAEVSGAPPAQGGWINSREILLLVVTLITTLTYQVGMNPPGGYWQDDADEKHIAGHPIMRDKDKVRYRVLMVSNWFSFYVSMVLTVRLLREIHGMPTAVKLLFLCSYTFLVFTYNVSQTGTSLLLDLVVWLFFLAFALYAFYKSSS